MEFLGRYHLEAQGILRIAAGLLFMQHGVQKLFGWLEGRGPVELFSQPGLAGVLEVFGGLAIVLGLLTRPVAAILFLEMLAAYFIAHVPRGPVPILNGGELALLYAFTWLFFATAGPGAFSLDRAPGLEKGVDREDASAGASPRRPERVG